MEPSIKPSTDTIPNRMPNNRGLIIGLVTTIIVAICSLVFGILQMTENSHRNEEINALQTEIVNLTERLDQYQQREVSSTTVSVVDNSYIANNDDGVQYFEPDGWNVRFVFPAGVTNIEYSMIDANYDGALYINSITHDGTIYDINICGGQDAYGQYPFFLGSIMRWAPAGIHEGWQSSPATYNNELILSSSSYEYYLNPYYGNGCELGDDAPGYAEAVDLVQSLLNSIQAK